MISYPGVYIYRTLQTFPYVLKFSTFSHFIHKPTRFKDLYLETQQALITNTILCVKNVNNLAFFFQFTIVLHFDILSDKIENIKVYGCSMAKYGNIR